MTIIYRISIIITIAISQYIALGQTTLGDIVGIDWSPDGKKIIVSSTTDCAGNSLPTTIRILSAETGNSENSTVTDSCASFSIQLSPDGTQFALGESGSLTIWDTSTLQRITTGASAFDDKVVAWSPDGSLLLTSVMGFIVVLDPQTGTQLLAMEGDGGGALDIAWSPNGTYIASDDIEGNIRIWDANTGSLVAHYTNHSLGGMMSLDWHPTDDLLVSYHSGSGVAVWDTQTHQLQYTLPSTGGFVVEWSPNGTRIASGGVDGVTVWDATNHNIIEHIPYDGIVYALTWNPDSTQIAYGGRLNHSESAEVVIKSVPIISCDFSNTTDDETNHANVDPDTTTSCDD